MYYNPTTQTKINSVDEIRNHYKNTSFPSPISESIVLEFGFEKIVATTQPENNFFNEVRELSPFLIDDKWTQRWEIVPIQRTEQEIAQYEAQLKAEKLATYKRAIQERLDTFAQTRGYDNIVSLCSYATSQNTQFAAEGQRGVFLRDQCWAIGYMLLAQAEAGEIPEPTLEEVLDQMPDMTW